MRSKFGGDRCSCDKKNNDRSEDQSDIVIAAGAGRLTTAQQASSNEAKLVHFKTKADFWWDSNCRRSSFFYYKNRQFSVDDEEVC